MSAMGSDLVPLAGAWEDSRCSCSGYPEKSVQYCSIFRHTNHHQPTSLCEAFWRPFLTEMVLLWQTWHLSLLVMMPPGRPEAEAASTSSFGSPVLERTRYQTDITRLICFNPLQSSLSQSKSNINGDFPGSWQTRRPRLPRTGLQPWRVASCT